MLLTVLLNERDELVAAGPTCDTTSLGPRYWSDVLGLELVGQEYSTAVIQVEDRVITQQLLAFHLEQDPQAQRLVGKWLKTGPADEASLVAVQPRVPVRIAA